MSGSVRYSTIVDLCTREAEEKFRNENKNFQPDEYESQKQLYVERELKCLPQSCLAPDSADLAECFKLFDVLHRLIKSKQILARITEEILADFQADNVVYLELRTTPRNIHNERSELVVSKADYLNTVLDSIDKFQANNRMIVRVLLSIDRTRSLEDALDTVNLAAEYRRRGVVGVDFSGNPLVSSYRKFHDAFELIGKYGLPVTVHIAEIWQDQDLDYILKEIKPQRIGHAVCLTTEYVEYLLNECRIPVEICPTSNLITKCVDRIENHTFNEFYKRDAGYPMVICTDDFGIFNTYLSNEYFLIARAFNLTIKDMFELSKNAINIIFDKSETTRLKLNDAFDSFKNNQF